jgi:antibiotic biosynthesis monooxygenase (ABM) superfamily enzyme
MENAADPVTVVVTREVGAGSESAFEEAVKAWIPNSLVFPGHLGVYILRPPAGGREYGAVLKFRARNDWDAFQRSPSYLEFLERIRPLLAEDPQVKTACGLETWFTPLGTQVTRVPPRWKMALITWPGVCFAVYVVTKLFAPFTDGWPWFFTFAVVNAGVVVGLTWAVMPFLNRIFRTWLLPREAEIRITNEQ